MTRCLAVFHRDPHGPSGESFPATPVHALTMTAREEKDDNEIARAARPIIYPHLEPESRAGAWASR
jgi:hypothetical protein